MKQVCNGTVTSPFGRRHDPINRMWVEHNGVDIAAVPGTGIFAPCAGQVVAIYEHKAGGKTLIIKSLDALTRFGFCHLSHYCVYVGQTFYQGEKLALTGNSGRTTGPHLHFTAKIGGHWDENQYLGGQFVDPTPYMKW